MRIKQYWEQNKLLKIIYRNKFYIDIGVQQIQWFTGKLVELMAISYFLEKIGVFVSPKHYWIIILFGYIFLTTLGYTWKKMSLYDTEKYVLADKDPVQKELLKAARKINNEKS